MFRQGKLADTVLTSFAQRPSGFQADLILTPMCFNWPCWGEYADLASLDYLFCRFGRILAASLPGLAFEP
jgi:hypothetical protein